MHMVVSNFNGIRLCGDHPSWHVPPKRFFDIHPDIRVYLTSLLHKRIGEGYSRERTLKLSG